MFLGSVDFEHRERGSRDHAIGSHGSNTRLSASPKTGAKGQSESPIVPERRIGLSSSLEVLQPTPKLAPFRSR